MNKLLLLTLTSLVSFNVLAEGIYNFKCPLPVQITKKSCRGEMCDISARATATKIKGEGPFQLEIKLDGSQLANIKPDAKIIGYITTSGAICGYINQDHTIPIGLFFNTTAPNVYVNNCSFSDPRSMICELKAIK